MYFVQEAKMRIRAAANPKGFTLVETILYVGLVSIVLTGMITFLWNVIGLGERSQDQQEATSQSQHVISVVGQEVRVAESAGWDGGAGQTLGTVSSFDVSMNTSNGSQVVTVQIGNDQASWQLPLSIPDPVAGTPTPTPTPAPTTCSEYCANLLYSSGTCRKNARTCGKEGETNESGGNYLCTGGRNADTCCCQ